MVAMLKRVPESKERLQSHAPNATASVRARLFQEFDEIIQEQPERIAFFESQKREVDRLVASYEQQVPKDVWLADIALSAKRLVLYLRPLKKSGWRNC